MAGIINFRGPDWFLGIDSVIQFFGAIIALILAIYGYKAYKMSNQKKYLLFSFAFLLLSLNLAIYALAIPAVSIYYTFYQGSPVGFLLQFRHFLNFLFILATLLAYTLLIVMYSKVTQKGIILLLSILVLSLSGFAYRYNSFTGYSLVATLLVLFILAYTGNNYLQRRTKSSMIVFFSFLLIWIGHIFFAVSGVSSEAFIVAHLSQLFGYAGILSIFLRVKKHAEKN